MAFAMVCFADLMKEEVEWHMNQFGADSYIVMSKDWARKEAVSPVIYYSHDSITAHILKLWIQDIINHDNYDYVKLQKNLINVMIPFYKQYKGHYYIKDKKAYSTEETLFYCEREWRYIPLVLKGEAYYLSKELFLDESINRNKIKELVQHGYKLQFGIEDIEGIHVPENKQGDFLKLLKHKFNLTTEETSSLFE